MSAQKRLGAMLESEIIATAFKSCTGYMAPYKDQSAAACGGQCEHEIRFALYEQWRKDNGRMIETMLTAVGHHMVEDEA